MPLINIFYPEKKSDEFVEKVSQILHESLREVFENMPEDDRFQIFHPKKANHLRLDKKVGYGRTEDAMVFYITTSPRTEEEKTKFYAVLSVRLAANLQMDKRDVFVVFVENELNDWSFGNGLAR